MKVCGEPGCPELTTGTRCPEHTPKPWATSNRSQRRGMTGWQEQALHKRVMARHNGICHICGQPGADIVDDVIPLSEGGPPVEANKRPAHRIPCHQSKTAAEAARARRRARG